MTRHNDGTRAGGARSRVLRRGKRLSRRGVAAVLAMMFLVIFSSLASVMAVVAQGNLRTAQAHLEVNRALSAAETGLVFATRVLESAASRFVVEKGVIDESFGNDLWNGTWAGDDGTVEVLPPEDYVEDAPATSVKTAVLNAHLAYEHGVNLSAGDEDLPAIDESSRVLAKPIPIIDIDQDLTFQLSYELLDDGRYVRVTSVGRDGELSRTLQQDFQIVKRLDAAIISPSRVMIGKNVHIEGPIGSRYGQNPDDLAIENGHPLVLRSDFMHLNDDLDGLLDQLLVAIQEYDLDGDNRLRPGHPGESEGLGGGDLVDYNEDGYVDDYDLWLKFYDGDGDLQVVWDETLAAENGYGNLIEEFAGIDDQLAALIDHATPDRNGDGYIDSEDSVLGYNDGVINDLDNYSKVDGRLLFKAQVADWQAGQGEIDYQSVINGAIKPGRDESAVEFGVSDTELYSLETSDFTDAQDVLRNATGGQSFDEQITSNLGEDPGSHTWTDHATNPDYRAEGLGDWEEMPLGSPGFYDWYKRAVYKNMTFVDVKIPMGNNGLFVNCTFIGATYVENYSDNDHVNWNYLGMKDKVGTEWIDKFDFAEMMPQLFVPAPPNPNNPADAVYDTRPFSNNIRFHDCTFIGSIVTDPSDELTHVRNKIQFTGATVFTLDEDEIDETNLTQAQKDAAHEAFAANAEELAKSSLMAPGYSVDIGSFDNDGQQVSLKGTIVAGVLDIRGTADVEGTLLMTYVPVAGEGPLFYGGTAAAFNTTVGYFSTEDGDGEGSEGSLESGFGKVSIRYNPDLPLPDGIMAPIKILFVPGTYREGLASVD